MLLAKKKHLIEISHKRGILIASLIHPPPFLYITIFYTLLKRCKNGWKRFGWSKYGDMEKWRMNWSKYIIQNTFLHLLGRVIYIFGGWKRFGGPKYKDREEWRMDWNKYLQKKCFQRVKYEDMEEWRVPKVNFEDQISKKNDGFLQDSLKKYKKWWKWDKLKFSINVSHPSSIVEE